MEINIFNQVEENIDKYIDVLNTIFNKEVNNKSMEVIFVTSEEIKRLNHTYRNIDKETDVLSFPNDDEDASSIGDIFINLEQAIRQASEYGHSKIREIAFLAVHGYLHLLGYDHQSRAEEIEMFNKQEAILKKSNIER